MLINGGQVGGSGQTRETEADGDVSCLSTLCFIVGKHAKRMFGLEGC